MFQSTPPCWGRRQTTRTTGTCRRFNPRPRAGGDVRDRRFRRHRAVSIHAPVLGATSGQRGITAPRMFQSTPPCWGRRSVTLLSDRNFEFQSTPPCWGRPPTAPCWSRSPRFQSTPPCWGRPSAFSIGSGRSSFNPRPRAGGDTWARPPQRSSARFNPRPRAGGDGGKPVTERRYAVSIHAPVLGATSA